MRKSGVLLASKRLAPVTSLMGLVFLVGCGGSGSPSTGSGLVPKSNSEASSFCADATLERSTGQPLDEIEVVGLAAGAERPINEIFGIYRSTDGDETVVPGVLTPNPEGAELTIIVPPHPAGIGGGRGTLHLTDGQGLNCPSLELTIEAIPPAPGTTLEIADLLEELLSIRTEALGSNLEQLAATPPNELPVALVPQAMALWGLQGSDNPDSLRAALEVDPQPEMLDALLARAEVPGMLRKEVEQTRRRAATAGSIAAASPALMETVEWARGRNRLQGWMQSVTTLALMQGPAPSGGQSVKILGVDPVEIETAEQLSRYMNAQADAARKLRSASRRVFTDTVDAVMTVIAIWAPGIGTAAANAVDGALFVYVTQLEWNRQLYPCCLDSFDYRLDKPYLEEDYPFPPEYARWGQVQVTASSQGWNLTQTVISAAEKTLTLGKGFKKAHKEWGTQLKTGEEVVGKVVDDAVEKTAKMPGDKLKGKAEDWVKSQVHLDELTIPPFTWGPIDITHAQWSEAEAEGAIQTVSTHGYGQTDLGQGKLTVETRRGKFGNEHKALAKLIEVRSINLSVLPSVKRVEPEEEVELRAFVRNSVSPEKLKWKVWDKEGKQLRSFRSEFVGGTEHRIYVTVPRDEDRFPIEVEAESTSRTGLRKNATDRRYGSATLTTGVVVDIGPEPACVDTKPPPLQMFAEVVGAKDKRIDWRVMSGPATFDPEGKGELTATGEGEAVVRGTSVADNRAWDEATIDVGKCTCSFSAILSGDTNKTNARGEVAHFSTEGKTTIMGAFSNPEALEDVIGIFGGMMGEEQEQMAEEFKQEMEAMPRETLGISLMEMDVDGADEQMLANFVGGLKLQASVMNRSIEPGFAGGLDLSYVMLHTGEYIEAGYPTKYEWAPGAPGNVSFIVNHFNGRSLSGTLTGNMFAPGLYKEATGEPPQISFSVYFYGLEFDPLNQQLGCITGGQ